VDQLLATKFYIPPVRPEIVSRTELIKQLNTGLNHKLTLISAPAGFGKTTLIGEWLGTIQYNGGENGQNGYKAAWLSLDYRDNDLIRFLNYFVTALNRVDGKESTIGRGALGMLQSTQSPPAESVLIMLINDLAACTGKFIFVLDDYHLIDSQPIHDALGFFIDNMPSQLHLVIATREDPLLPIPRLRARDQLTELRAANLRFTSSEVVDFLNRVMRLNLSVDDITALETRTEGWIVGLQLAAISLQGRSNVTELIKTFSGSHRLVLDYLIEEVLNQQTDEIQNFLLKTAVINRLTGSLCDALTDRDNSHLILETLERANLFIIPLDNERQWYRYHHLFADLLQQKLRRNYPDKVSKLHLQACVWYQQMNMLTDAIHHALAAEDYERVADLAELAWPEWNASQKSITWLGWLKELPEELVRSRPVLCVACAQALLNAGQLEAAEAHLQNAERLLGTIPEMGERSREIIIVDEEQFRGLPARLATTRAYHAQAIGDATGTVKYVKRALELFPEDDRYNRAAVTGLLGLAYWTNGDLEAAYKIFSEGMFQNVHDRIKGTFVLADMQMILGYLREAERTCEQGLRLAKEFDPPNPIGTEDVYSEISYIHREQGDLVAAARDLDVAKKLGEQVMLPDWQHRWYIAMARLKESEGDLVNALDLLEKAELLFVRTPVPETRPIAAMKVRVFVKQDRLPEALHWVLERNLSFDDRLNFMQEFEHLTLARVLLAKYRKESTESSIQETMGLLGRLLTVAESGGRMGNVIEILLLQALALDAQDDLSHALVSLERALTLAELEGYFQIFIDEGTPMARLLYEALSRKIATDYVQRLLSAFPDDKNAGSTSPKPASSEMDLIEPLSEREIEILQLIADGLSNQEIGSRLYLSLNTVKAHTRNIYGKLGVNSRTQAAARARALGILPTIQ